LQGTGQRVILGVGDLQADPSIMFGIQIPDVTTACVRRAKVVASDRRAATATRGNISTVAANDRVVQTVSSNRTISTTSSNRVVSVTSPSRRVKAGNNNEHEFSSCV